ncbi:hypothetical protein [Polaribacter sp. AHE13PA]|uniref:hypothetical protein n=1 Tax=Polaribacter sp. AHE13PA TaxID=2745562 RepID=UPI001C4FC8E6|nr:hypothetical protein [Polaribacter sp. AHE13PA]QXP66772.1 hypothetical protein H0I28_16685 [Polaribacter sp. AHE13PA]
MKTRYKNRRILEYVSILFSLFVLMNFVSCSNDESCDYDVEDDGFPFACSEGMDVAFLIDYTGSMGGAIDGIKSSVAAIANTIVTESGGDYRLSLSIFDEQPEGNLPAYAAQTDYVSLPAGQKVVNSTFATRDQYLTMMEKFGTNNKTSFSNQLAKLNGALSLGSGVGSPEPGGLLFNELINNSFAGNWRTTNITKLAIIITDAVAGGDDDIANGIDDTYLASLAAKANLDGIQVILVSSLATSNYEISLVDINNGGLKLMNANLNNVGTDIIKLIEDICVNNEK